MDDSESVANRGNARPQRRGRDGLVPSWSFKQRPHNTKNKAAQVVLLSNRQDSRTMKRLILGVAAALLLSTGPAAADGLPSKGRAAAPVASAGPNWNGFYLGVGI